MNRRPLRLGIVGCGEIAPSHARAAIASPLTDLVACHDVDALRGRAFAETYSCMAHRDLSSLLDTCDAVVVCTPPRTHRAVVIAAFEAGCHVLCEKELAPTVEECREMVDAARRSGSVFAVGFRFRHDPLFVRARDVVRSGALGPLTYIHLWMPRPKRLVQVLHRGAYPGGVTLAHGCHGYDLMAYLVGTPTHVGGYGTDVMQRLDGMDDGSVLTFRWGPVLGTLGLFWVDEGTELDRRVDVFGLLGHLTANYAERLVVHQTDGDRTIVMHERVAPFEMPGGAARHDFFAQLENFVRACAGDGALLAPAEVGLQAVEAINGVRASAGWLPK